MAIKRLALASAVTAILAGCGADDQSYEYVDRDAKEIKVSDLRLDGRWFYAPTTGAAPRFAVTQFPFLQGMGRYVELCFSDEGLEVRGYDRNNPDATLPKDANGYCLPEGHASTGDFLGGEDTVNFPHVMTIGGSYAKYQCQEDSYGDCTNKEEADSDPNLSTGAFRNNSHFTPDPSDTTITELNFDKLYGTKEGLTPQGSPEVISWEFDPKGGVLNFELEQTFSIDLSQLSRYIDWSAMEEELANGSFKARFYYSLVHEDHLASKDYQPVVYPRADDTSFGFFTTTTLKLNPITNKYDDVTYLNRFNPELGSIKYYLTDNFFEEKNKIYLDSTIETVNKMNQALSVIGVDTSKPPIEIVNKTEGMGVHPGDLRYNVINLVDEPLDNGLLGYGPSVAHPMTGEIIKAHVNQYSGVARTGSAYYWNNLARFYNREQLANVDYFTPVTPAVTSDGENSSRVSTTPAVSKGMQAQSVRNITAKATVLEDPYSSSVAHYIEKPTQSGFAAPVKFDDLMTITDESHPEDVVKAEMQRLQMWSENTVFPVEAMWISATQKSMIDNLDINSGDFFNEIYSDEEDPQLIGKTLKTWKELGIDERRIAADALTITTYANTLVHELGHNLGLRHNFKGSNDSGNFYSEAQAKALGLRSIPAYSSTMDYAPSMLDETPTWGLYDLEAFKFAYGREIDVFGDLPVAKADLPEEVDAAPEVTLPEDREPTAEEQQQYDKWLAYSQYLQDLAAYQAWVAYTDTPIYKATSDSSLLDCRPIQVVQQDGEQQLQYTCSLDRVDRIALIDEVGLRLDLEALLVAEASTGLQVSTILRDASQLSQFKHLSELNEVVPLSGYTSSQDLRDLFNSLQRTKEIVRHGVINYVEGEFELERESFAFCTDGNVSLNSDCNRFDEGTNIDEIISYKWQSYIDNYENRNVAILNEDGLTTYDYMGYIMRRLRGMNEIREVIEDSERLDDIYTRLGFARATDRPLDFFSYMIESDCKVEGDNTLWFCDTGNATRKAASYFLSILRTPEHQCVLETKSKLDQSVINTQVISLGEFISSDARRSLDANYNIAEASCFDEEIKAAIVKKFDFRKDSTQLTTPIAETENGRFLNSVGSFDPSNNYSNSVSALGIWPDKALASYLLARRYTLRFTDEVSHAALMDWPGVKNEFDNIMEHLIANEPLSTPVSLVDGEGNSVTSPVPVNLHATEKLEALPPLPCGVYRFLRVPCDGRADIPTMLLDMAASRIYSPDYDVQSRSLNQLNSWVKERDNYYLPDGSVSFVLDNSKYAATESNTLAWKYANKLNTMEPSALIKQLDAQSQDDLKLVVDTWGALPYSNNFFYYSAIVGANNSQMIAEFAAQVDVWSDYVRGLGYTTLDSDAVINFILNETLGAEIGAGRITLANGTVTHVSTGQTYSLNNVINMVVGLEFANFGPEGQFEQVQQVATNVNNALATATPEMAAIWSLPVNSVQAYLNNDYKALDVDFYQTEEVLRRLPTRSEH
ncbi:M66 family metalloprotease [Vibrio sinaloensis]|uniref:M66 family metalloprotease n=1 Tax=Photobacterium sp. (strain ATCC 43367) TaxID=379097 RepID=UPI00057E9579|nr:M66 family metalloprotease [Vibrio sinaloensis]